MLIRAWREARFELLVSEFLLTELALVLDEPYFRRRLSAVEAAEAVTSLRADASIVALTVPVSGVATHPEDDLVLATAVSARADYWVTGDQPLRRKVPAYQGVPLVSPREFLSLLYETT